MKIAYKNNTTFFMQFTDVNSGSRPCLLPPIPFLNSPREKNQNGNGAAGAEGGNARYSARWGGIHQSDH